MLNWHRMVLLGLIIAQGVNLVAGEQPKVNLSNSGKEIKIAAAMVMLEKKNSLGCSTEVNKEERPQLFYPWPGGNPEYYYAGQTAVGYTNTSWNRSSSRYNPFDDIKPYYIGK